MTEPEDVLLADLRRICATADPAPPTALPCGLRSPDCARPEHCDDCLPRDRKHIHERVLVRCDPSWYGLRDDPPKVFAALRAVVDLCTSQQVGAVDGRPTDADTLWPSDVLTTIARELGIEENHA